VKVKALRDNLDCKADAAHTQLDWAITSNFRLGCLNFRFGRHVASLAVGPDGRGPVKECLSVNSDGLLTLLISFQRAEKSFTVVSSEQAYEI
jgi:hypothetical protein